MKNPLRQLQVYWHSAHRKKDPTADYFLLATVDSQSKPHVRTVLIKTLDKNGIGFVTNAAGPKVKHCKRTPFIEGCIVWPTLTLQVRVSGKVKPMPKNILKVLWSKRPREAQLLYSLGLSQSSVIPSYQYLLDRVAKLGTKWRHKKVIPLSPSYIGYIVEPASIEFLHHNPTRLNKREHYRRTARGWRKSILAP